MTAETIRNLCQAGELAGARLVGRRWIIHAATLAASFGRPEQAPARPRTSGRPGGSGNVLARIASGV